MYNGKYSADNQNRDNSGRQPYNKSSSRVAARRRKQRQKSIVLVGLVIIAILAIGILLLFKSCNNNDKNASADQLVGTWVYDQYTKYEFDGYGSGCMCLEDTHYEYSYEIKGDTLFMDFDNEAVHDCSYTYEVDGNKLTIVGGEGTTGGTYTLNKS